MLSRSYAILGVLTGFLYQSDREYISHTLWLASLGPDGEVMELFVRHRLPQLLRHWEVRPMFRRLH